MSIRRASCDGWPQPREANRPASAGVARAVGYRKVAVSDLEGNLGYLAVFGPRDEAERIAPSNIIPCATPKG
jgi:hypothetical protein